MPNNASECRRTEQWRKLLWEESARYKPVRKHVLVLIHSEYRPKSVRCANKLDFTAATLYEES